MKRAFSVILACFLIQVITIAAFPVQSGAYIISGQISGDIVNGVLMTLSGDASATTTTHDGGIYEFSALNDGSYTVTPSLDGYSFTPKHQDLTIAGADQTDIDFTSTLNDFYIYGTVTGDIQDGVLMTLSGDASATTTTFNGGNYVFPHLDNGTYIVTPSLAGYSFSPPSHEIIISGGHQSGIDFIAIAIPYTINGQVTGDIADGVLMSLSGDATDSTTTHDGGLYEFLGVINGTYTVTPNLSGYMFTPSNQQVTISGSDQSGVNFTAAKLYALSGNLTKDARDRVPLKLYEWVSNCGNPDWFFLQTDRSQLSCGGGQATWSFDDQLSGTYKIVPKFGRYTFVPDHWEGTLPPDQTSLSFEMNEPSPLYIDGIVCLGDSLTYDEGNDTYPARLSVLTGLPHFNEGIPGDRVQNYWKYGEWQYGISARFYEDVESYFPSNCVVLGGVNDIKDGASLESIQTPYADIFTQATEANIRLTTVSVLPFKGHEQWDTTKQEVLDSLNQWLQTQCAADPNATYVNAYTPLEDPNNEDALLPQYDSGDHVHLTIAGYEKLADEIYAQAFEKHSIGGQVTGDVSDGVLMNLSGDASATTTTHDGGLYDFSGLLNGSYTVTPSLSGYTFSPPDQQVTVSGADQTGIDFTAAAQ